MNGGDWLWVLSGLAVVGILTGGIGAVLGRWRTCPNSILVHKVFERRSVEENLD